MKVYIVVTSVIGDPDKIVNVISVHKSAAGAEQKVNDVLEDQRHDKDIYKRHGIAGDFQEINYFTREVED